jgi:tetratricopeptide (TPR) repeat protein
MQALRISILFNMGYWYEMDHQLDQANVLYKQIIHEQPDYIDAYLRASVLAQNRGDTSRAIHWIDESTKCKLKAPYNQLCQKAKILMD